MIFVTVGSMFPFDRLIQTMDNWAAQAKRYDVFAQIGNGEYVPQHIGYVRKLSQSDFFEKMTEASVIVAHAGMGTVITAGRVGRPLVILPRIESRGEHTTDHQIATANWLRDKPGITVADTDENLPAAIEQALVTGVDQGALLPPAADLEFTGKLQTAINNFLNET